MATEKTILVALSLLSGAYPLLNRDGDDVKAARLRTFREVFADLDDDVLIAATRQLIAERDSDFAPSVGSIRNKALRLIAQATQSEPIDEYKAWGIVQRCIGALGYEDTTQTAISMWLVQRHGESTGATIAEAIRRIGWRDLCMTDEDDLAILRAQFRNCVTMLSCSAGVVRRRWTRFGSKSLSCALLNTGRMLRLLDREISSTSALCGVS